MARRDLDELRDAIIDAAEYAGGLSNREANALQFYGENRLNELLAVFNAVVDAEIEWEDEPEDDGGEPDGEPIDYPEPEDDGGEPDWEYDDEGYWEIEATFDYGEDQ